MRILITGIAGSGKTTLIKELKNRGYIAIDLDDSGICEWVNKNTGEVSSYCEGAGKDWIKNHRWQVIVPKLVELLNTFPQDQNIFVGGKIARAQVHELKKVFDKIYLLKPANHVLHTRLATRTSNTHNFAKTEHERHEITSSRDNFESACLDAGAIALDNHGTVEELLKIITEK